VPAESVSSASFKCPVSATFTAAELYSVCMALVNALKLRPCKESFPAVDDKALMNQLGSRLWALFLRTYAPDVTPSRWRSPSVSRRGGVQRASSSRQAADLPASGVRARAVRVPARGRGKPSVGSAKTLKSGATRSAARSGVAHG